MTRVRAFLGAIVLLGAGLQLVSACSQATDGGEGLSKPRRDAGGAGSGAGPIGTGGNSGGSAIDPTGNGGASGGQTGCASFKTEGKPQPVDIFIMLDQSLTMMGQRWTSVVDGLTQFINDPATEGIGVGIQYFGQGVPLMVTCDINAYATPAVPIAPLPQNAAALVSSLKAHGPVSETPTFSALSGAIQYAMTWQAQNPNRKTVVLFATDGDPWPFACPPSDVNSIAQVAAAGHTSGIDTYVIGMQGATKANLDAWAAAGGTGQAFDATDPTKFIEQMNAIRGAAAASCTYDVPTPDAGAVDYKQVKVIATIDGAAQSISPVTNADACGPSIAWYYDDSDPPKSITLCPSLCDSMRNAQGMAGIELDLGCLIVTH